MRLFAPLRRVILAGGVTYWVTTSVACSALLAPVPGHPDAGQVRQMAARIADGVMVAEVALDAAGQMVDALPLSPAQKDALDCAILKVNGHDAPSPTVLQVCGPIPPVHDAPISRALVALRQATTMPGLCGTVQSLLTVLEPLIGRLEAAEVPMAVVKTALGFTMRFAGGC